MSRRIQSIKLNLPDVIILFRCQFKEMAGRLFISIIESFDLYYLYYIALDSPHMPASTTEARSFDTPL